MINKQIKVSLLYNLSFSGKLISKGLAWVNSNDYYLNMFHCCYPIIHKPADEKENSFFFKIATPDSRQLYSDTEFEDPFHFLSG